MMSLALCDSWDNQLLRLFFLKIWRWTRCHPFNHWPWIWLMADGWRTRVKKHAVLLASDVSHWWGENDVGWVMNVPTKSLAGAWTVVDAEHVTSRGTSLAREHIVLLASPRPSSPFVPSIHLSTSLPIHNAITYLETAQLKGFSSYSRTDFKTKEMFTDSGNITAFLSFLLQYFLEQYYHLKDWKNTPHWHCIVKRSP